MYKVIIFDFFGVIETVDIYDVWLERQGYTREGVFHTLAQQLDSGQITLKAFYDNLSRLSSHSAPSIDQAFTSLLNVNQAMVRLIKQLSQNYRLGLLCNGPAELVRPALEQYDLHRCFDEVVISSEVGLLKPDPQIFELLLKQLGTTPSEALFIDDRQTNVAAAGKVGVRGVRFIDAERLRHELRNLHVRT